MGLVVFSGETFTQVPLTTDHSMMLNMLRDMKCGMLEDGTAIGDGLASAISRLKDSEAISKVVILLTDGDNNAGSIDPSTAAEMAKLFGIRVYTIGAGTRGMAPYPVQTPYGIQYQNYPVEIDENTYITYTGRIVSEPFIMSGGQVGRDIYVWRDLIKDKSEASIDADMSNDIKIIAVF